MKKFKVIEEGVLSHAEMENVRGGVDTSSCTSYSCTFHAAVQCFTFSYCTSNYLSCTGPKNSEKMSCKENYVGPVGPGGLTAKPTNISIW